jgi:type IV pilus assembly protein PilC
MFLWRLYGRTTVGRLRIDTLKLKMPIFGRLNHELEMARLVTYMGLFYRTGVDLLRGLALLEQMMTNARIARAVGQARAEIAGGDSIAHALASTKLFPTVVIRSFALGESTGKLDESLERARVYYAREVPAAVRRMLTALQPVLIVFLGGILGLVAMSIFLPILEIYKSVGK